MKSTPRGSTSGGVGRADYLDLVVGDTVINGAVWTYPSHFDDSRDLSAYASFACDKIDEWSEAGEPIDAPTGA